MTNPTPRRDDVLVRSLRSGDETAFRDLVAALNPGLLRVATMYVSAALAEEVVQETWIAVVGAIDRFEQRSSVKTWIYQILMNKVRSLAVRESKIVPFAAMGHAGGDNPMSVDPERLLDQARGAGHWSQPPKAWDLPAELLEQSELLDQVSAAIGRLPVNQREVVDMRDVQGLSAEEVCNALGISSVNQRVLLHRGRAAIRSRLEEYLNL